MNINIEASRSSLEAFLRERQDLRPDKTKRLMIQRKGKEWRIVYERSSRWKRFWAMLGFSNRANLRKVLEFCKKNVQIIKSLTNDQVKDLNNKIQQCAEKQFFLNFRRVNRGFQFDLLSKSRTDSLTKPLSSQDQQPHKGDETGMQAKHSLSTNDREASVSNVPKERARGLKQELREIETPYLKQLYREIKILEQALQGISFEEGERSCVEKVKDFLEGLRGDVHTFRAITGNKSEGERSDSLYLFNRYSERIKKYSKELDSILVMAKEFGLVRQKYETKLKDIAGIGSPEKEGEKVWDGCLVLFHVFDQFSLRYKTGYNFLLSKGNDDDRFSEKGLSTLQAISEYLKEWQLGFQDQIMPPTLNSGVLDIKVHIKTAFAFLIDELQRTKNVFEKFCKGISADWSG